MMKMASKVKTYSGQITSLGENEYFVFGSNTQGRHGKGAALMAKENFGAEYGNPRGFQGQSYAICTKDLTKRIHPSVSDLEIKSEIFSLYQYALVNKNFTFYVAYSGLGSNLNAYTPQQMADMFASWGEIPSNIVFEENFALLLAREEN